MEKAKRAYVKRTQKDYSLSFKLSVVREVESGSIGNRAAMRKYGIQGHGTITDWRRKYGIFETDQTLNRKAMQSPEQRIKELEQTVRMLERKTHFLEEQLTQSEDKAAILDKVIELAEREYLIPLRKNFSPDQSNGSARKAQRP